MYRKFGEFWCVYVFLRFASGRTNRQTDRRTHPHATWWSVWHIVDSARPVAPLSTYLMSVGVCSCCCPRRKTKNDQRTSKTTRMVTSFITSTTSFENDVRICQHRFSALPKNRSIQLDFRLKNTPVIPPLEFAPTTLLLIYCFQMSSDY